MNLDNINKWLTLSANLGVLAGIVFLAIEIGQNNEQMEAQSRLARFNFQSTDSNRRFIEGYDLPVLVQKYESKEQLTDVEQRVLESYYSQWITDWQFVYREYTLGNLNEEDLTVDGWAYNLRRLPLLAEVWERRKSSLRPDFVETIESHLTN